MAESHAPWGLPSSPLKKRGTLPHAMVVVKHFTF